MKHLQEKRLYVVRLELLSLLLTEGCYDAAVTVQQCSRSTHNVMLGSRDGVDRGGMGSYKLEHSVKEHTGAG